jgi:hypothetical protein
VRENIKLCLWSGMGKVASPFLPAVSTARGQHHIFLYSKHSFNYINMHLHNIHPTIHETSVPCPLSYHHTWIDPNNEVIEPECTTEHSSNQTSIHPNIHPTRHLYILTFIQSYTHSSLHSYYHTYTHTSSHQTHTHTNIHLIIHTLI